MTFRDLRLRVRALLHPGAAERDLQDELAFHVEREAQRLAGEGATRAEALRKARVRFGSAASVAEACRDVRGARGLESVAADLRFGVRYFAKRPLSVITMIVIFALGVGVNTALFLILSSFVNGPLPGASPDDAAVRIRGIDRTRSFTVGREFSYPEYIEYASHDRLFRTVAAWTSSDASLGVGDRGETLISGAATYVTPGYFEVLGVPPILGAGLPRRSGGRSERSAEAGAVISHFLWERHFGSAPDVVGRTMKVNGVPVTIAGVLPRRFAGARTGGSHARVWLPLDARPALQPEPRIDLTSYDSAAFGLVADLQPGVAIAQTLPTVQAIAARAALQTARAGASDALSTDVVPLLATNYFPGGSEPPSISGRLASLAVPLIILLITCTNVSALQTGLAMARRREIAVRMALGASRRRVVRHLVTESVLLACAAGALAVFVLWVLWRLFDASLPDLPLVFDWRVFLFSLGVAVTAGVLFGVSPALHATRLSVTNVLKEAPGVGVASRSRLQSTLVIAQIALTQPALLVAGAILLNMSAGLRDVPSAPAADRVLDVRFNINPRYGTIDQRREEVLGRLREHLRQLPGVTAVVPQDRDGSSDITAHPADQVEGARGGAAVVAPGRAAPPGYFALMGWPIVRGRDFVEADRGAGVVVITEELARRLWAGADPLGRRIVSPDPHRRTRTVIGVIDDTPGGNRRGTPQLFVPDVGVTTHFLIRTQGPAQASIQDIRAAADRVAREQPIVSITTLDAREAEARRSLYRIIRTASSAGGIALFLTAIGLYAVVAFAVEQRVREIGIRGALGASRRAVVRMFLVRGLRLALIGSGIGLTLSLIAIRLLGVTLGDIAPEDTTALAAVVAAVMIGVATLATWIPARRAATVDPIQVLRAE